MFQEFPKCLYLGADVAAAFVVVCDQHEEQAARAAGFAMLHEPQEKAKRKKAPTSPN